jgi:gliding motility-associated-like protein
MRKLLLFLFLFLLTYQSRAQVCTILGQTPQTAFPVCGTDTFSQKNVPICRTHSISTGCNDLADYGDKNPFWYTFTCFSSGTLGFQINPNTQSDDYDWQLFDVTGVQDLNAVFTNASLSTSNNWSSNPGSTGTSTSFTNKTACAGPTYPNQSAMPQLIQGHVYLLLVSHFDNSQDGYSLYFKGGTASITDTLPPDLKNAKAPCDGTTIAIKLNKKMKCSTLVADGSDFSINYSGSSITAAAGIGCSSGFDMDSVVLTLNNPIAPGNYFISVKVGSDNNTILDNCNTPIPVGKQVVVAIYPLTPSAMDSMSPLVNCLPDSLLLFFKKPIVCGSVAADGSDFIITGPSGVTVTSAKGLCSSNLCDTIKINFATPLFTGGIYQVKLVKGSDGNTLLNECGMATPENSVLTFTVKQAVLAPFTYKINYGCKYDIVYFSHDGANGVSEWLWTFDNNLTRSSQNDSIMYYTFEPRPVKLVVTNGVCSDSSTVNLSFPLNDPLKAAFLAPDFICPNDTVSFINNSVGNAIRWSWDFSNGQTSSVENPPIQKYPSGNSSREYPVSLSIWNALGCVDTAYRIVKVVSNCYIAVPSAFTPNGDGLNDFLYPLNAYKATNLLFRVYNRYGQLIFETKDWTHKWDGTFKRFQQPAGAYVWTLDYTDNPGNKKISLKGTTVLIR